MYMYNVLCGMYNVHSTMYYVGTLGEIFMLVIIPGILIVAHWSAPCSHLSTKQKPFKWVCFLSKNFSNFTAILVQNIKIEQLLIEPIFDSGLRNENIEFWNFHFWQSEHFQNSIFSLLRPKSKIGSNITS